MIKSKYLDRFKKLASQGSDLVSIKGNRIFVEIVPPEEIKTAGGLIIATPNDHRTTTNDNRHTLCIVLATGEGYYDVDEGKHIPVDVKAGDVILVSPFSLKTYTTFPMLGSYTENDIALTRDTEVHMSFPSVEAYEKAFALLNTAAEK